MLRFVGILIFASAFSNLSTTLAQSSNGQTSGSGRYAPYVGYPPRNGATHGGATHSGATNSGAPYIAPGHSATGNSAPGHSAPPYSAPGYSASSNASHTSYPGQSVGQQSQQPFTRPASAVPSQRQPIAGGSQGGFNQRRSGPSPAAPQGGRYLGDRNPPYVAQANNAASPPFAAPPGNAAPGHSPQRIAPSGSAPSSGANRTGASVGQPGAASDTTNRGAMNDAPFGPLSPQNAKLTDLLLSFWEFSSKDIQRYQCKFQVWRYDPVFGPQDPNVPAEYSEGVIKYEAPDRGVYKVEKSQLYRRAQTAGGKPSWIKSSTPGDHWVCDGQSLFEFDWKNKVLIKHKLPPNVQGVHIANGPLPFLLKAKAAKVKERFWVRAIPAPAGRKQEYWVEAYPKSRADSAKFQKLHIVLNKAYRPKALVLFSPGYRPSKPSRTTYEFDNIQINPNRPWFGEFVVSKAPAYDWREVEESLPGAAPEGNSAPDSRSDARLPDRRANPAAQPAQSFPRQAAPRQAGLRQTSQGVGQSRYVPNNRYPNNAGPSYGRGGYQVGNSPAAAAGAGGYGQGGQPPSRYGQGGHRGNPAQAAAGDPNRRF